MPTPGIAANLIQNETPKASPKRTIKQTEKGGLFIRDESFRAFSESKQKPYTAGLNCVWPVADALFKLNASGKPSELLKAVCGFVAGKRETAGKAKSAA